jgi:Holliday junction DNA helicase RuvA
VLNSIAGEVSGKTRDCLYISTGGVEWEIWSSAGSLAELPEPPGSARVWVYLQHRENAMQLYGFSTPQERQLFLELLKVDGMGPRMALKVLSGMRPAELSRAVQDRDAPSLARVPGVGRKTAEKIVLALAESPVLAGIEIPSGSELTRDLVAALAGMGFDRREAMRVVDQALSELGPERLAIALMSTASWSGRQGEAGQGS